MFYVNEKSGFELTATFKNAAGAPSEPITVHWRLDDEKSGTTLVDWTPITTVSATDGNGALLACTATIEVPGPTNVLIDDSVTSEAKQLLVVAAKDQPREYSSVFRYRVRNVRGRS